MADALLYGFVDHDYGMATLSALGAVTAGAGGIAKTAKVGSRLQRTAQYVVHEEQFSNATVAEGSGFLVNVRAFKSSVKGMNSRPRRWGG